MRITTLAVIFLLCMLIYALLLLICFDFGFVYYSFGLKSDQGVCFLVLLLFFLILLPAHKLP